MTEVAEGIHRLTNGVANFYLIEESGKLVLVDSGAPRDWDLASLDGINAGILLAGHGDPWTGGAQDAIRRARAAGRS